MNSMVYPPALCPGDKVAILSPATIILPERVEGAECALLRQGYQVRVMPHALDCAGSFAGKFSDRLADISEALVDTEVKAILCSRGGFGCIQLLEGLSRLKFPPKWLIGFSDVSALHAFMWRRGIVSIHGSMAKALTEHPATFPPNAMLLELLRGRRPELSFGVEEGSRPGVAHGQLVGGNLAVLQALIRTPYDLFQPGRILFIEDIAEPIYKVERIMRQLRLAGVLDSIAGLIFGRFTDYRPDRNYQTMEEMLRAFIEEYNPCYPIAFGAPIGHVDDNIPLLHGAEVTLEVSPTHARLTYSSPLSLRSRGATI